MKEILNKLNELIFICDSRVKKCEEDASRNAVDHAQNEADKSSNFEEKKKLSEIADRLSVLQGIANANDELSALRIKIKESLAGLDKEKSDFDAYVKKHKNEFDADIADLKRREDKLTAAEIALDEEKKKYKIKIIEQVNRENKVKR